MRISKRISDAVARGGRRYIAAGLLLILPGMLKPALAGDFLNTNLPKASIVPALKTWAVNEPAAALHSSVAFALPQPQTTPSAPQTAKPNSQPVKETNAVYKWLGIAMMAGGGAVLARGVTLKDPCNAYAGLGAICTSNYPQVRAAYISLGGATAVVGAILFFRRNHT